MIAAEPCSPCTPQTHTHCKIVSLAWTYTDVILKPCSVGLTFFSGVRFILATGIANNLPQHLKIWSSALYFTWGVSYNESSNWVHWNPLFHLPSPFLHSQIPKTNQVLKIMFLKNQMKKLLKDFVGCRGLTLAWWNPDCPVDQAGEPSLKQLWTKMLPLPGSLHLEVLKRHWEVSQLQSELKASALQLRLHLKIFFFSDCFNQINYLPGS